MVPSIDEEVIPHGLAEDAAAQNANAAPFVTQEWINSPAAIHANNNKIGEYNNKDNGIIEVVDIPPGNAPPQNPIIAIHDSAEDAASTSKDSDSDLDDDDDDPDFQDAHNHNDEGKQNEEEHQEDDDIPGLRRSKCRNRGWMTKYTDCGLMIAARRTAQGGQCRAIIRDGFWCFLAKDLHNAKPIPEEDHKEYALGVAMVQY